MRVGSQLDHHILWPTLPNFTSLSSPSSVSVTGLRAPLSSSLIKRRYIVSRMNEWLNEWMNEGMKTFYLLICLKTHIGNLLHTLFKRKLFSLHFLSQNENDTILTYNTKINRQWRSCFNSFKKAQLFRYNAMMATSLAKYGSDNLCQSGAET